MKDENYGILYMIPVGLIGLWLYDLWGSLNGFDRILTVMIFITALVFALMIFIEHFSAWGKANKKRKAKLKEVPLSLLTPSADSVLIGQECDLLEKVYLPNNIRARHVHILGSTGSGKTESVILNFLRQDVQRGLGSIVLDAKGDASFIKELYSWVPENKLCNFDLTDTDSIGYNPLEMGSPLESAQRLFSSLTWSEEYYKSKALSALQRIFETYAEINGKNPTLVDVAAILDTPASYSSFLNEEGVTDAMAIKNFQELSGLRDQVKSLTLGHLKTILSPSGIGRILLSEADQGKVLYFRLQSLMSPKIVGTVGKLLINNLNFLAGTAHRERIEEGQAKQRKLVPVYLDEFATFACPEFADLISKARSARFALHFSHQSIGDLAEVSKGFLNRITDNTATKIVMRINDPDSADHFARAFGTRKFQKSTQRVTNAKDMDKAEIIGEGTVRDGHQFRAKPDVFKLLPTGVGAVLVAHGQDAPEGASSVFRVQFPELRKSK